MFEKLFDIEISVPTRFLLEVVLRRETERKCYKWEKNIVLYDDKFDIEFDSMNFYTKFTCIVPLDYTLVVTTLVNLII